MLITQSKLIHNFCIRLHSFFVMRAYKQVLAFFIYDFAFIVDASRKTDKTFVGLDVDSEALSKSVVKSAVEDASLARSFTPHEVKELVQNNIEILSDYDSLFRGSSLEKMYATLDRLIEIADQSGLSRPFTVEEFDDRLQKQECVYGIVKDAINERIIVVFRGTENELAFSSNWRSNASIFFRKVELPDILKGKLSDDDGTWKFHSGFHKYLFGDKDDEVGTRKYDDIMDDLKSMLAKYPNYRVFVTGHSLGAALSSVTALYFACEEDLPKPIHCINFASPRMGNEQVLEATVHLEKTNQLRMLRSVNENDTVTTLPTLGYEHGEYSD